MTKQTNKQANNTCYYYTKTIQNSTKTLKQPRKNTYDKWESENIKLLTRLKPCKNMFPCGQRVKGNHWVIAIDGNSL